MDLNNMESVSSLINSLTGGAGIEGLGDISKLTGLLGNSSSGLGLLGNRFPILLIIALLILFGNRGGYNNYNYPQYACCCCRKKRRKHHKRRCCCCYSGYDSCGSQQGGCGCGGYGGGCGNGGYGNIIFIIIILILIRFGRKDGLTPATTAGNIFNFNATDVKDAEEDSYNFAEANEEE